MQLVFKFQPLWCTHFWENGETKMWDFGPRGWVKYIVLDDVKITKTVFKKYWNSHVSVSICVRKWKRNFAIETNINTIAIQSSENLHHIHLMFYDRIRAILLSLIRQNTSYMYKHWSIFHFFLMKAYIYVVFTHIFVISTNEQRKLERVGVFSIDYVCPIMSLCGHSKTLRECGKLCCLECHSSDFLE